MNGRKGGENPSIAERIDRIADEFSISDREALRKAVNAAMRAMARAGDPATDGRLPDTLDKLDDALQLAHRLLDDTANRNRLGAELGVGRYPPHLNVFGFRDMLITYATAAKAAHRGRAQKTGKLAERDLPAGRTALIDYWERTLCRPYTQNHAKWDFVFVDGGPGLPEPATEGERFIYRVLSIFVGRSRATGLRALARTRPR